MNHGPKTNEKEEDLVDLDSRRKGSWAMDVYEHEGRNFDSARSLQALIQPLELCHYDTISFQ
ncbi:hypothetical protein CFP56_003310 [Quercus suber]|uniref:Uncharacterized protein n=1 Tax=Quercus suber TaxID=58331 RepID=A0AAW0IIP2_QUESU